MIRRLENSAATIYDYIVGLLDGRRRSNGDH
jgi:hypothetical protein